MVRPPRPDFYHTYHHVVVRGVNGYPLFDNAEKRSKFLELMREVREAHDISIYAFGFLDNHLHMFCRRNENKLARFFQRLKGNYTKWYNSVFDRDGTLYGRRYFSSLVDSDRYFYAVWSYVQNQGVAAGLFDDPCEDQWSTASLYKRKNDRFNWIEWEEALNHLDIVNKHAEIDVVSKQAKKWMADGLPITRHRNQDFIAGEHFIEDYLQYRRNKKRAKKRQESPLKWKTLLKQAEKYFKVQASEILKNTKKNRVNIIRCLIAWTGRAFCHQSIKKIGTRLNVKPSTVSKMIKRAQNKYKKELQSWKKYLECQMSTSDTD